MKLNYNWVGKILCQFIFCAPLSKERPPTLEMKGMWILVYGLISLISTCVRMLRSKSETQSNNPDRAKIDLLGKNYICWIKIIVNKCCSLNFCQISLLAWAHIHIQNNSLSQKARQRNYDLMYMHRLSTQCPAEWVFFFTKSKGFVWHFTNNPLWSIWVATPGLRKSSATHSCLNKQSFDKFGSPYLGRAKSSSKSRTTHGAQGLGLEPKRTL